MISFASIVVSDGLRRIPGSFARGVVRVGRVALIAEA